MPPAGTWIASGCLAAAALVQAAPDPPASAPPPTVPDDPPLGRSRGGGEDLPVKRPDLSRDFDPFAPGDAPPARPPAFDPSRPNLSPSDDPLAARIRNGPAGAELPSSPPPPPWRLPGEPRLPSLADPPPGSAPATALGSDR